jgi:5-(aminomethyl)-3-furanmethanol phosphate kinase
VGGTNRPVVVKLGGSFAFSEHLPAWIAALAACAGRVVIVPGGGPFADAVRSAQPRMGFDDGAAHHMALLAMEQYGRALVSLNSFFSPADSDDAIHRELAARRVPIWMPARMVLGAAGIAPSWDVTSDSLAAWLAGRIGAGRLLLVKHVQFRSGQARAEELAEMGIVDHEFARHLRMNEIATFVLGPSDHEAAVAAIREDTAPGILIK